MNDYDAVCKHVEHVFHVHIGIWVIFKHPHKSLPCGFSGKLLGLETINVSSLDIQAGIQAGIQAFFHNSFKIRCCDTSLYGFSTVCFWSAPLLNIMIL